MPSPYPDWHHLMPPRHIPAPRILMQGGRWLIPTSERFPLPPAPPEHGRDQRGAEAAAHRQSEAYVERIQGRHNRVSTAGIQDRLSSRATQATSAFEYLSSDSAARAQKVTKVKGV